MVGLSDLFLQVRGHVLAGYPGDYFSGVLLVTGMAGIGKTALARLVFNDGLVRKNFECFTFVRVGQTYEYEGVLRDVIAQVNVDMTMEEDESVEECFGRCLKGRKYLIVLDDLWDIEFLIYFDSIRSSSNGSILVTSRIQNYLGLYEYQMRLLSEEESWELLRKNVFDEEEGERCPPQLVKPGKEIAKNCEGLPLLILTVAEHLSEAERDSDYWTEVASMKTSVFEDACDQIYEILVPSYHFLNQNSKACFLYMGVFPKDYVVTGSRIINLWCAERFTSNLTEFVYILDYIVSSNLAVFRQKVFSNSFWVKAFSLHIVYRHLSRREGEESKFMFVLDRFDPDGSYERMEDKHRLAIHHNTLLAIKEVHSYIDSVTSLRSVLRTGPYHQYQVPLCLGLKLLRVLDALSIRFYEFPVEVVRLIQLRYLSLTSNMNLPRSIHRLRFLQFLILHQHWRISRDIAAKSYVPVEVWELQELEHLQIVGRNLPEPPPGGILPKLKKLLDVGVQSCAKGVLECLPKLEKLRVQIESSPNADQTISCFDHVSCLIELRSLVGAVINPKLMPHSQLLLSTAMSNNLRRLSLKGFGYPWEEMSKIAELMQGLEILKLQCFAFRGEKWESEEMRFSKLKYLLIEDADLVEWTATIETFPLLSCLRMKSCYKVHEIPIFGPLRRIELVDCNPLAETCANQTQAQELHVSYSWK